MPGICLKTSLVLGMKRPAERYRPSPRPCTGLQKLEYPLQDRTFSVTQLGRLRSGGRNINLSAVFAGRNVGVREAAEHIWIVSFKR